MSDTVTIALITATAPVVATIVTWLLARRKVAEVHDVVNSKHEEALRQIKKLETEVRRLNKTEGADTPDAASNEPVTLTVEGEVQVRPPEEV